MNRQCANMPGLRSDEMRGGRTFVADLTVARVILKEMPARASENGILEISISEDAHCVGSHGTASCRGQFALLRAH